MARAAKDLCDGRFTGITSMRWLSGVSPLRERNTLQEHLGRWSGGLWAPSVLAGPLMVGRSVFNDLQPWPGEPWATRASRLWTASRHATSVSSTRLRGN
jgi:hypothetical protein